MTHLTGRAVASRRPGVVTRTAWLMLGAAIGLAAALLAGTLANAVAGSARLPAIVVTVLCLLPVPLLALVPGVRELEQTAARTMLRPELELLEAGQPADHRADHRWLLVGWVAVHLVSGLTAGCLLLGLVPGAIAVAAGTLTGAAQMLQNVGLPLVSGTVPRALVVLACAGVCAGCLLGVWGIGLLARVLVGVFLGPTWRDRLLLAEARLAAEVEHTRLARELHDGIGHALTLINVQAVAGRRLINQDPARAETSLAAIEDTARSALTELDTMLGILRDGPAERAPAPDLTRLDRLLDLHRESGLDLTAEIGELGACPALVSQTAYQVIAEALTNAHRHAGTGPVRLALLGDHAQLSIEVSNPRRPGPDPGRRGRGVLGMTERVRLLGGTLTAHPEGDRWVLRAVLPTGASRAASTTVSAS